MLFCDSGEVCWFMLFTGLVCLLLLGMVICVCIRDCLFCVICCLFVGLLFMVLLCVNSVAVNATTLSLFVRILCAEFA